MHEFTRFLHQIERCPLCQSTEATLHSLPRNNRYSEAITAHLEVDEEALLQTMKNLLCSHCGLIYKKYWFEPEVLHTLFNELIPLHPRGWDTVSGRFNPDVFYHELGLYAEALKHHDIENINRYRRALTSIIDSIQENDLQFDRTLAFHHIETGEPEYFTEHAEKIRASFGKPEQFKRFSGYASPALWDYTANIAGPIRSYAELGCPLWGMLRMSTSLGIKTIYVKKEETNFWTDKCRDNGMTCLQKCSSLSPEIEILDWDDLASRPVDLMGIYQYIDHLEQPMDFFSQLFNRTRTVISIIDDAYASPSYIQHFTGWTAKAIQFVADTFSKKVNAGFTATQSAGHNMFIFHP